MHTLQIGISVVSLLPYSYGGQGLLRAAAVAKRCGVGLQLNPLIGYRTAALAKLQAAGVAVLSAEYGVWADDLSEYLEGMLRRDFGKLASPLLFGFGRADDSHREIMEAFPEALEIDHPQWRQGRGAVEIAPFNHPGTAEAEYLAANAIVFDTWHVRDDPTAIPDPLGLARRVRESGKLRLIHCQTRDRKELASFIEGAPTMLETLLQEVLPADVPVVIELDPRHVFTKKGVIEGVRDRISALRAG